MHCISCQPVKILLCLGEHEIMPPFMYTSKKTLWGFVSANPSASTYLGWALTICLNLEWLIHGMLPMFQCFVENRTDKFWQPQSL